LTMKLVPRQQLEARRERGIRSPTHMRTGEPAAQRQTALWSIGTRRSKPSSPPLRVFSTSQ
jgi:hypothetical protein